MATTLVEQAQPKEQLVSHQQQQRHLHRSPIRKLKQLAARKERQITSLLVVTQVLRLLLSLVSDPAATHTASHFRSQLTQELEAAAAAACLDGDPLTALTLLKHLPAARLQQLREAARRHPRKHSSSRALNCKAVLGAVSAAHCSSSCSRNNSSNNSQADGSNSCSNSQASFTSSALQQLLLETAGPAGLPYGLALSQQPKHFCQVQGQQQEMLHGVPAAAAAAVEAGLATTAPLQQQQQQQQQQLGLLQPQLFFEVLNTPLMPVDVMPVDVGCLLETTLVVAAAEAQINSLSFEPPGSSNSLQDDACSKVNIEGVLLEEFELAQLNGLV